MNRKRWKTEPQDLPAAARLAGELGVPDALAQVLLNRGFGDPEQADRFLHPRLSDLAEPEALPGMPAAVARIRRAIDAGETIVVYGDYDVDGLSSTALLVQVLRRLGARAEPFLPSRMEEGYGLSSEGLARCIERHRPGLIVTVDCGANAVDVVREARGAGVDVVVTDHHELSAERPQAVALVNPHLAPPSPWSDLAGVGVAFKLCHALVKQGRGEGRAECAALDLREYFGFVALGTIADIVPLRGENRILARYGLDRLGSDPPAGVRALLEVAGVRGPVSAYHVGFRIGPRLNAAGRLGTAEEALELLLTEDPARRAAIARSLDEANRRRQQIELETFEEASERVERTFRPGETCGIVVAGDGWHPGVIGIVASRLVGRFHRPVVVVAWDGEAGRGSCRSIEPFNMVEGLEACGELLERFGGHAMAAGLDLSRPRLSEFAARFDATVRERVAAADLQPVQRVDAWLSLAAASRSLYDQLQQLRPFGAGNPSPVWGLRELRVMGAPRVVGRRHLKMLLAEGGVQCDAIGFGLGGHDVPDGPIDVAAQLQLNRYAGREMLQLQLRDFRAAGEEPVP